tara:strand:+ start:368 stop:583 length:216 start_codon:yes stop_codon:yes gene_type:complete
VKKNIKMTKLGINKGPHRQDRVLQNTYFEEELNILFARIRDNGVNLTNEDLKYLEYLGNKTVNDNLKQENE